MYNVSTTKNAFVADFGAFVRMQEWIEDGEEKFGDQGRNSYPTGTDDGCNPNRQTTAQSVEDGPS